MSEIDEIKEILKNHEERISKLESSNSRPQKASETKSKKTLMSDSNVKKELVVPVEINDHYRLFGKEPWEIEYGDECPYCGSRYDEFDNCACGAGGE